MSRRLRVAVKIALGLTAAALLLSIAAIVVLQSAWFHDYVRRNIVAEVEKATGGRAEIASFHFDWSGLRAEVRGLIVHGREGPGEAPLLRADSVTVGFKIISLFRRKVDLALLAVRGPEVNVIVDASGRTNVPEPRLPRASTEPVEQFLDLAIGQIRIHHGRFSYRSRSVPLHFSGEQLQTQLSFERGTPAYRGNISIRQLRLFEPLAAPLDIDTKMSLRLQRDRLDLSGVELKSSEAVVTAQARIEHFDDPRIEAKYDGSGPIAQFVRAWKLPVRQEGSAKIAGAFTWSRAAAWTAGGTLSAKGVGIGRAEIRLRGVAIETPYRAAPGNLELPSLHVAMLGGDFRGRFTLAEWDRFDLSGSASRISLARLRELAASQYAAAGRLAIGGLAEGQIRASGSLSDASQLRAGAGLTIAADEKNGVPLSGTLAFDYEHGANRLAFRDSTLQLPSTRVQFNGALTPGIDVTVFTRNAEDFVPFLALYTEEQPPRIPVRFEQGDATFQGKLDGTLDQPRIAGKLDARSFHFRGRKFQHASAAFEATSSRLRVSRIAAEQDTLRLDGAVTLDLDRWQPSDSSTVQAQVSLRQGRIDSLLAEAGWKLPVNGAVSGFADVRGTIGTPRVSGEVTATEVTAYGESLDRVNAEVRLSATLLEVPSLRIQKGPSTFDGSGSFERHGGDWDDGELRFRIDARDVRLAAWKAATNFQPDLDAAIAGRATAAARLVAGKLELTSVDSDLRLENITYRTRALGSATLTARTTGRLVAASLAARLAGAEVTGGAEWSLTSGSYGLGHVQASRLTLSTLQNLGLLGVAGRDLPVGGSIDGEVAFSGPILNPGNWTGNAKITSITLEPAPRAAVRPENAKRLTLRNREPILAHVDSTGLHLQQARLIGEGTDLVALGTVGFRGRAGWNLQLRGSINLPVLAIIEPDLVALGRSTLDATIRGSLNDPQIVGRMDIVDGAFNLRGVPNGLEKTNGVIRFDRSRATIEKLTAQSGGGDLSLSGFVGFGGEELVYRLQATAQRVRVRYPEAVSTTFNAILHLTGTPSRRLLSGNVTVTRIGITPKTDIGSILAETGRSVTPTAAPNPFLRGMQLDVQVETSPDAELLTSLTRDIQPEANLRLRGSANRPVVLGRISVNQGEIQFFGNQYTITRGDISFFNPVKIEPVLSLDLETRVRGITVTINFTGPMDKLNVSYRSDPPLNSTEIVALLAVGRAPGTTPTTNPQATASQSSVFSAGGNSLLGQAVAAPITGRLQRLFGVTRLKIDPELTGVTNIPQAWVTAEQQLSREVTVTYIFNLNRAQQQIVRLQWDFSKDFSVLAVRDENGIFGVDFLWRKRFK